MSDNFEIVLTISDIKVPLPGPSSKNLLIPKSNDTLYKNIDIHSPRWLISGEVANEEPILLF